MPSIREDNSVGRSLAFVATSQNQKTPTHEKFISNSILTAGPINRLWLDAHMLTRRDNNDCFHNPCNHLHQSQVTIGSINVMRTKYDVAIIQPNSLLLSVLPYWLTTVHMNANSRLSVVT